MNPTDFCNRSNNPDSYIPYFGTTLKNFVFLGTKLAVTEENLDIHLTNNRHVMPDNLIQEKLLDYYCELLHTLDDYLNGLHYFLEIGQFDRNRALHLQTAFLDKNHIALTALHSDMEIRDEIDAAISAVYESLDVITGVMNMKTKRALLSQLRERDPFTLMTHGDGFPRREYMEDRMSFHYWTHFGRRLNRYELSDNVADFLDFEGNDLKLRQIRICAILSGDEQKRFPPHLCTLGGYGADEIMEAKRALEAERLAKAEQEQNQDENKGKSKNKSKNKGKGEDKDDPFAFLNKKPTTTDPFAEVSKGKTKMPEQPQEETPDTSDNVLDLESFIKKRKDDKNTPKP